MPLIRMQELDEVLHAARAAGGQPHDSGATEVEVGRNTADVPN